MLYAVYGDDIIVRLKRIYTHLERDGPDGSLVVALFGRNEAYVRCAFAENGKFLVCEARPGRAGQADARPLQVSATIEAALQECGYWRDETSGRFLFRYEIDDDPGDCVWGGVSVALLNPLIDVFGAHVGSKIEIIAPLAPKRDGAAIRRHVLREPGG